MWHSTFTLTNRSIRHDIRRRRFHLFRLVVAVWLMVYLCIFHAGGTMFGAPGLRFFASITWLNVLFTTLAGIGYFATAISEEKEEMTLDLFLIAGIGPLAIITGKSINRLLGTLSVLVVQIPFTMLAITLGGVQMSQVIAVYVLLAAYLFFVANVGLLWSVVCRRAGPAIACTATSLGVWLFGNSLFAILTAGMVRVGWITTNGSIDNFLQSTVNAWSAADVLTRVQLILRTGFAEPPLNGPVSFYVAAGSVLFLFTWSVFRWFNRGASLAAPDRSWFLRPHRWLPNLGPRRPWRNPVAWKDFYFFTGGKSLFIVRLIAIPALTALCLWLQAVAGFTAIRWWDDGWPTLAAVALTVLALELVIQASRIFHDEIQWKTLSNLALLPQPLTTIARAKVRGCLIGCLPAALWFTVAALAEPWPLVKDIDSVQDIAWLICVTVHFVLLLHIMAHMSLIVKWGALPLAIMAFAAYCLLSFSCLSSTLIVAISTRPEFGLTILAGYATALAGAAIVLLHVAIGRRLETAKGQ